MRLLGFALALGAAALLALGIVALTAALVSGLLTEADWLDAPAAFVLMLLALGLAVTLGPLLRGWIARRNQRED